MPSLNNTPPFPSRRSVRVYFPCTGLGRQLRGFETFTLECAGALREDPRVALTVFSGAPVNGVETRVLWNLPRSSRLAAFVGRCIRRDAYFVEQLTFFLSLLPSLVFGRPDLVYFADYIASIDAMAAGELDFVTQTLNDTMASVAFGSDQVIVVVNDNSTGNDKIICDGSINSIEDMAGKTVAAEAGVVDHFLLDQGLASVGMTEDDIDFRGVLTDAAAAGFAGGEFDCVGVFAPFWITALEREGSHEVFSSADFPGLIPDHIVATRDIVDGNPAAVQKLVDAWYLTLDYMQDNPDEATTIMAGVAETSVEEYEQFAEGTTLFTAEEALAAFQPGDDTTSLQHTAELINPFLVDSGFTETEAPLDGLFDASFTQDWVDRAGD